MHNETLAVYFFMLLAYLFKKDLFNKYLKCQATCLTYLEYEKESLLK